MAFSIHRNIRCFEIIPFRSKRQSPILQ
jgi:hypothetical protein